jgi:hypothetical protein
VEMLRCSVARKKDVLIKSISEAESEGSQGGSQLDNDSIGGTLREAETNMSNLMEQSKLNLSNASKMRNMLPTVAEEKKDVGDEVEENDKNETASPHSVVDTTTPTAKNNQMKPNKTSINTSSSARRQVRFSDSIEVEKVKFDMNHDFLAKGTHVDKEEIINPVAVKKVIKILKYQLKQSNTHAHVVLKKVFWSIFKSLNFNFAYFF